MNNLFLWTLFLFVICFLERLIYTINLKEPEGRVIDRLIAQVTIGSYLFIVSIGFLEFIIKKNVTILSVVEGSFLICAGILFRRMSISTLGRNWSIYIRDIPKQELIKKGIYKHFKHPYYIAVSFELLGVVVLFQSVYAFLLFLMLHVPLLIFRISIENKFHKQKFFNY